MSKPVVFVIGATGKIGSATVAALAAKYSDQVEVRAGVRNPEKADKLKDIAGVTIVKAEMGTNQQLIETFKGVSALFINTPGIEHRGQITVATVKAAKEAGVKAVIVVSGTAVNQPIIKFGQEFVEIERKISELGIPYTFLRLPYFMENFWAFRESIVTQGNIYSPNDPTKPFSVIVVEDAGKAGAAILVDPTKHANKAYNLVSDRVTYGEVADGFSKALGKEVKYVRVPYEATKQAMFTQGMEDWQVNGLLEALELIDSGSPAVDIPDISAFHRITGEQPTDLKAWIAKHSSGFQ